MSGFDATPVSSSRQAVDSLLEGLGRCGYAADRPIATTVHLGETLGKPLLVEGPAGTGKTQLAKTVATLNDVPLIRLQCYEGIDEAKVLYEWDYRRQLLWIQAAREEAAPGEWSAVKASIFSQEFLLARPLLQAILSETPVVLLIDEVDRLEPEMEALLLEVLGELQVSIPELGTIRANSQPQVFLTSNGTRELSEALRRRCLYLYLDYPTPEREAEIIGKAVAGVSEQLSRSIADAVALIRTWSVRKPPSIAESIDWARVLSILGIDAVDEQVVLETLNVVLKSNDDIAAAREAITQQSNH